MADSADQVLSQFKQALQSGDNDAIESLISDNLQSNLDRGGIKAKLPESSNLQTTTPSAANVKVTDTIATGDTLVLRFSFDVKGSDVPGADPSKTAHVNAIAVAKTKDGKVVSVDIEPDTAGIYFQLGLGIADAQATQ